MKLSDRICGVTSKGTKTRGDILKRLVAMQEEKYNPDSNQHVINYADGFAAGLEWVLGLRNRT